MPIETLRKEAIRDLFPYRFEVRGQENLEFMKDGQAGIFPIWPHQSHLDTIYARKAFPPSDRKKLIGAAAEDYWYELPMSAVRFVLNLSGFNTFRMSRTGFKSIEASLDRTVDLLESGYSILLAPEGTRSSKSLEKRVLRPGLANLILKTRHLRIPVVPIELYGLEGIMPKGSRFPRIWRLREVIVTFGEPIFFDVNPESTEQTMKEKRRQITDVMKEQFLAMSRQREKLTIPDSPIGRGGP